MKRILIAALAGLVVLSANTAIAEPATDRNPAAISGDLTEPWIIQLFRGERVGLAFPVMRRPSVTQARAVRPSPQYGRAMNPAFLPRTVRYDTDETEGTIIIDTEARYLYLILGDGSAKRYGVGVGRPGFEWAGVHRVSRKAEWPDWTPPEQMLQRQPDLPRFMEGGPDNPLGARALYLGSTLYRIHGSNQPWTIGHAVSSGCIRMRNEDVIDLYERVDVGSKVIVI